MLFEKKKIQIETLSEYLVSVRQNLGLSALEVSQKVSIKPKYLASLEQGEFKNLPADVYVLGFLKQLGRVYAIDADVLIEQYKKEKGIERQMQKQGEQRQGLWSGKFFKKIIVTPKILSFSVGFLFVVLTVGYIVWQVWSINRMPNLKISEPVNNSVIKASSVFVRGSTDPGLTVSINGENIFVDNKGGFEKQLGLNPGPKEIVITAKNRFDKSASQTINIIGTSQAEPDSSPLDLKAEFSGSVVLGVNIDDQETQNYNFQSGDSKLFFAKSKVVLSTSDAGATKITVNGQSMGAMGRSKEALSNVAFYPPASATTTDK